MDVPQSVCCHRCGSVTKPWFRSHESKAPGLTCAREAGAAREVREQDRGRCAARDSKGSMGQRGLRRFIPSVTVSLSKRVRPCVFEK